MKRRVGTRAMVGVIALAMLAATTSCSAAPRPAAPPAASAASKPGGAARGGLITVFAAASLTTTFTALAHSFEAKHPGTTVRLSFAGSSDLVTQITEGAPADVFASADPKNMARLPAADLRGVPRTFATNVLEIAVPPGNPASIATFADLAKPGVKTVVCAPQVPCGAATVAVEAATRVTLAPVSEESAVTDVLGKVSSGEADAGLVYVTDVQAAGASVRGIPFAQSAKAVNSYPIAAVRGSGSTAVAAAFIAYVTGAVGRSVLKAAGFGAP